MPKPLDGKFYGTIFRHKDNAIEPPDSWIVFVARDNALPATLEFYAEECKRQGCDNVQVEAVYKLLSLVEKWRDNHADRLKKPDVHPGELAW